MVRTGLVMVLALWMLAFPLAGCGGPDLVIGGSLPATPTPVGTQTPTCISTGGGCTLNGDCCSQNCNIFGACQ
jgi:hypothetical protein